MKTTIRLIALLAVFASVTPICTFADDKTPPAAPTPPKAKGKFLPLYAQVDSITDTLLTVKGSGADTKFVINADTKISKDKAGKEPATVSDVKVGQWIGGSYTKGADGALTLHSLHLGVNQKGPKTK